ncbi:hypothetical protein AVEN_153630-1 [Araneus ventricosus]|uniref:Transposase Tc1-like domain-containing protein n=1 Tax=Araneus ventricosus TaxID=182803 RepID=A0A4Y2BNU1_ARAVE|nr:hypothetical protein AVEN_153630-1 [Araneus ventricosus]
MKLGPWRNSLSKLRFRKGSIFQDNHIMEIFQGSWIEDESKSSVKDVATAVVEASSNSPHISVSVPVVSRVLDMPYSTVRKILRRILNFYPYKIKPVRLLRNADSEVRTTFALEFLARMVVDVTWPWNILWSDEAHFCLNGHVNTHNCRICAAENPHAIQ